MNNVSALILSAGYGKRLLPLTSTIPKALVSVGGRPLIDYAIDNIKRVGINHIIVNLHYFPQAIAEYLNNKMNLGVKIDFSYEEELLGTGGAIKKALNMIEKQSALLVYNVDSVFGHIGMINTCIIRGLEGVLNGEMLYAMVVRKTVDERNVLTRLYVDESSNIHAIGDIRFNVPTSSNTLGQYNFLGVQLYSSRVFAKFARLPERHNLSEFLRVIASEGVVPKALVYEGRWCDAGTFEGLTIANEIIGNQIL